MPFLSILTDQVAPMIHFYFVPAPNPNKISLFLEEAGLEYQLMPIDTRKGDQHTASFRAINPNGKLPAIVDLDASTGTETKVFDSTAILMYLAEKTGQFLGRPEDRPELLSWLMFIATGVGPYSGQAVHFQTAAPSLPYAINRYRREVERHYQVLDDHLASREFMVGEVYSIADMSLWGWVDRAPRVLPPASPESGALDAFPNLQRWYKGIDARPAVARAKQVGTDHTFKTEMDEAARRALFPSNYPDAVAG
jgi:GST-like protein